MINKSAAIIIKDKSVLYLRKHDFLFYILPGGRIEQGETTEQALEREIMEELSSRVKIIGALGVIEGKGFNKTLDELQPVTLNLYQVELLDEVKFAGEIFDMAYIKCSELHKYSMTPIGIKTVQFLHSKGLIE